MAKGSIAVSQKDLSLKGLPRETNRSCLNTLIKMDVPGEGMGLKRIKDGRW
ncbi:MAG: hypothetical protein ACE5KJ_07870 [Candidatus Zixiibacteriota bacterium]